MKPTDGQTTYQQSEIDKVPQAEEASPKKKKKKRLVVDNISQKYGNPISRIVDKCLNTISSNDY